MKAKTKTTKSKPQKSSKRKSSGFKGAFGQARRTRQARAGTGGNSQQQQPPRTPRPLRGASIIDFAERQIDFSKSLAGNRWLSVEQGAFVVAPSGHGKSTLVIQLAACWSCGLSAFGIHPRRPLRILVIQSEDDDNDIIEMAMLTDRLGLSQDQRDLVRKNTHLEWVNDVTGPEFFNVIDDFLTAFPADVLIINPYSAYQGGNIWDDGLNNEFLRIRLSALLTKHRCGALVVHHTPKTQYQKIEELSWFDWMYTMAGGSALTNWARGVMIMVPSPVPGTYKFIAAKRFEKIGWQDREYWFSHSVENGKFLWIPSSQAQIAGAKGGRRTVPDDVLTLIPVFDPISQEELWLLADQKLHIKERTTRNHCNILIDKKKIFIHRIPRQGTKSAVAYAQTPPSI
jgi:AAA domain